MESLELVLFGCMALLVLIFVFSHTKGQAVSSILVGISAGLVAVQVFRVHVFTLMVLIWACQRIFKMTTRKIIRSLIVVPPVILLALTAVFGDLVNSATLVLQLLGLGLTAMVIIAFSTAVDRRLMLRGLLVVTTVSSTIAVLQVAQIIPTDVWHLGISSVGRPVGIYPEPDWLGMFAGIGTILAWRLDLGRAIRIFSIVANFAAFILAFARAAWVALAVAVVIVVILQRFASKRSPTGPRNRRGGRIVAAGLILGAAAVVLTYIPQFAEDLLQRLDRTLRVQDDDISGQARVRQINALLELAESAPYYGHGLSASGRVTVWGEITVAGTSSVNNVASNWILAMWVDGKFLALPLILLLSISALLFARTIQGQLLVFVLLCSFFSNATFFPITWLLLAICLAPGSSADDTDSLRPAMIKNRLALRQ